MLEQVHVYTPTDLKLKQRWIGSRNALWVLARCWALGLRPPTGAYKLIPRRGQKIALEDHCAAKSPMVIEHEDWRLWSVRSTSSMEELHRYHREGKLQAQQRSSTLEPHRIDHFMAGYKGVPLLPANACLLRRVCPWCGMPLGWAPMPKDEHDHAEPLSTHTAPICDRWKRNHAD